MLSSVTTIAVVSHADADHIEADGHIAKKPSGLLALSMPTGEYYIGILVLHHVSSVHAFSRVGFISYPEPQTIRMKA